jgi:hypothetical protein
MRVNWNPTDKDLNGFRLVALGLLPAVAVVLYAVRHVPMPWCLGVAGAGLLIWGSGLVSLTLTRWMYVGLTAVTLPIGLGLSFLLMTVFYFGLLTPVALVFRLMKRDVLNRHFDASASTYWQHHTQVQKSERYFQQF